MKAFYSVAGKGSGLSPVACFALVKRLLARNEGRSLVAEDRLRVLKGITLYRGQGAAAKGYCLVVNDKACLDNATGPMWDDLLAKLGVASRATMPPSFDDIPFCGGDSLYRIASPAPADGGEVRHVMLESSSGRFETLLEEVTNVDGARAAIVTTVSESRGPMTCVMVEFGKEGVSGGSLESLFPSAEVIRVSDDSRRLVFTHLGSSCRWMFEVENDIVLAPLLARERLEENKALVTFRGEDGALEAVLCSWSRSDESGLGSFVKLSLNTPERPLLPGAPADELANGPIDMPVWLAEDGRASADDRRLYVIDDGAPLFAKVVSRIVDAAELSGQGALSFARWVDSGSGACNYAFRSAFIAELESYRDVRAYRIIDAQLDPCGLAVRQGYRFVPEMPDDDGWVSAVKSALFDAVGAERSAWALVDPCEQGDDGLASIAAVIIPELKPFEGYRKHVGVFGPVLMAELIADEKARHHEFSIVAEKAWNQASETERANRDERARVLFDLLDKEAAQLDQSLLAMRDDVRSTKEMASPLHAEAKLTRNELAGMTDAFVKAMRAAADKSANWAQLQKQLIRHAQLLEALVGMLDDGIKTVAKAELERVRTQNADIEARLAALKQSEAVVIDAHSRSAQLVALLERESSRVDDEIVRREASINDDSARVAEFDALVSRVRSLAAIEHAKALGVMKVRHEEAQCVIREQEARDEMKKLEVFSSNVTTRLNRIGAEAAEIARKRDSIKAEVGQVRAAEADRDRLKRELESVDRTLADMIKAGDPRQVVRHLLDRTKALRDDIAEVEEARRLLADGDTEIIQLEAELGRKLGESSLRELRASVKGSQEDIESMDKAIAAIEDVLAACDQLDASRVPEGRAALWADYRSEALRRLNEIRGVYLRSRNPVNPPVVDEINAAIEALRQLLLR